MAKTQTQPIDETALAHEAEMNARPHGFKRGDILPDDFENPAIGTLGHLCVRLTGKDRDKQQYQPGWMQLIIHKINDGVPSIQYFNDGGKEAHVKTGVWVDVPAWIVHRIEECKYQEVEQNYTLEDLRIGQPASRVVNEVPRFAFSALPSA